jgi:hypothetical protein
MQKLKNKLKQIVKSHLADNNISPEIAIDAMIEFYGQNKSQTPAETPDNDMLLFQYGSYDWDGKGKKFELDITRQITDPKDDEFYQISLTLYYKTDDIGDIKSFNLWSIDKSTIADWITTIKSTEGFKQATSATPFHYKVDLNKT